MRFHQLDLGARFEHGGEPYRKTAPLLATHEETGKQRVIPRSANVHPVEKEPEAQGQDMTPLTPQAVLGAFEAHHRACMDGVAKVLQGEQREQVQAVLEEARSEFRRKLAL